ncbi:MAG: hypothetical protein ACPH77_13570, partial [Pseudomonadales bacterium]
KILDGRSWASFTTRLVCPMTPIHGHVLGVFFDPKYRKQRLNLEERMLTRTLETFKSGLSF